MKQNRKTVGSAVMRGFTILLALVLVLSVAACGKSDFSKNFVGTWEITAVEAEGMTVSGDMLAQFGMTGLLELKADKTLTIEILEEDATVGKWEAKDATTLSVSIEEDTVECVLADGKLTMEIEEVKMIFTKK